MQINVDKNLMEIKTEISLSSLLNEKIFRCFVNHSEMK